MKNYQVTLDRVSKVLKSIEKEGKQIKEISGETGIPIASTFRIVRNLREIEWVTVINYVCRKRKYIAKKKIVVSSINQDIDFIYLKGGKSNAVRINVMNKILKILNYDEMTAKELKKILKIGESKIYQYIKCLRDGHMIEIYETKNGKHRIYANRYRTIIDPPIIEEGSK